MGRVLAVPHLCEFYPGVSLTTEEKAWKNLSQGLPNPNWYSPSTSSIFFSLLLLRILDNILAERVTVTGLLTLHDTTDTVGQSDNKTRSFNRRAKICCFHNHDPYFGLLDYDIFQYRGMWIPRFGRIYWVLMGGGMFLKDVTILKSAVIQNWHLSCYPQTLGSAVRKILQCQLMPPSANEYGHHLTHLLHWLLVPESTLRPTTEMIMAHVAVAETCQKLTLNLGRVPVIGEKRRPWSLMQSLATKWQCTVSMCCWKGHL